ncbi:MAG: hypothetical protein ABI162_12070 [Luteolibacter sp.]
MIPRTLLPLIACLGIHAAKGDPPREIRIAHPWRKSFLRQTENGGVLYFDSAEKSMLRGFTFPGEAKLLGEGESPTPLDSFDLRIDWLTGEYGLANIRQPSLLADGRIESAYQHGKTTFTRTVVAARKEKAVFIHLLTDKPGALSFRVSLNIPAHVEDRRQLVATADSGLSAHVWVLPFEAEVAEEGQSIVVRGEGEALIVVNFSHENGAEKALSQTFSNLGAIHDPGHSPPDPSRIWQGVIRASAAAPADSPEN